MILLYTYVRDPICTTTTINTTVLYSNSKTYHTLFSSNFPQKVGAVLKALLIV